MGRDSGGNLGKEALWEMLKRVSHYHMISLI